MEFLKKHPQLWITGLMFAAGYLSNFIGDGPLVVAVLAAVAAVLLMEIGSAAAAAALVVSAAAAAAALAAAVVALATKEIYGKLNFVNFLKVVLPYLALAGAWYWYFF